MSESTAAISLKRFRVPENLRGLAACAVLFAIMAATTEGMASVENLRSIGTAAIPLFLLALGQMAVIISGGIDLSVTATMALSSITGAVVMRETGSTAAGVTAMLTVGAAIGLINGAAVAWLRLPPFMVTLTTQMFLSGLAVWAVQSKNIGGISPGFVRIGKEVGIAAGIAVVCGLLGHVLLRKSVWGRQLFATGFNAEAARFSGLPVPWVRVRSYIAGGLLAAAAAVILTARLETGSPVLGQRMLLDVIGAAVLGGVSLHGGRGHVLWVLGGALFFSVLDNALNLRGLSHFKIMMAKGGVLLAAAALDAWRSKTS
ncbi:MAG TPA: ABC transporter permease [Verrucomicrobiales bacterium]|nr:ABC transporter permease [Verrucomicrobiales bacterium]